MSLCSYFKIIYYKVVGGGGTRGISEDSANVSSLRMHLQPLLEYVSLLQAAILSSSFSIFIVTGMPVFACAHFIHPYKGKLINSVESKCILIKKKMKFLKFTCKFIMFIYSIYHSNEIMIYKINTFYA